MGRRAASAARRPRCRAEHELSAVFADGARQRGFCRRAAPRPGAGHPRSKRRAAPSAGLGSRKEGEAVIPAVSLKGPRRAAFVPCSSEKFPCDFAVLLAAWEIWLGDLAAYRCAALKRARASAPGQSSASPRALSGTSTVSRKSCMSPASGSTNKRPVTISPAACCCCR